MMHGKPKEEGYYRKVIKHVCDKYEPFLLTKDPTNKKKFAECGYVLSAFLDLYVSTRKDLHKSWTNKLQNLCEQAASYVIDMEPAQSIIDKITEGVPQSLRTMNSLLDLFRLIVELRNYADMAQSKNYTMKYSLLSLTLHSMAGYIIRRFSKEFEPLIKALKKEKDELQRKPREDYEDHQGINVEDYNEQYNLVALALGSLNIFDGFNSAYRMKLLPYYITPSDNEFTDCRNFKLNLQHGAPIVYQSICMRYVYEKNYRAREKKSFLDFRNDAINEGRKRDNVIDYVDEIEDHDLLSAPKAPLDVTTLPGEASYAYVLTPNEIWYVDKLTKECYKVNLSKETLQELLENYDIDSLDETQEIKIIDKLKPEVVHSLEEERKKRLEQEKVKEAELKAQEAELAKEAVNIIKNKTQEQTQKNNSNSGTPPLSLSGSNSSQTFFQPTTESPESSPKIPKVSKLANSN